MEFVFNTALQNVPSTKVDFKHPPCNGSTLLHLPLLFGLSLSVGNSCNTHYFNAMQSKCSQFAMEAFFLDGPHHRIPTRFGSFLPLVG